MNDKIKAIERKFLKFQYVSGDEIRLSANEITCSSVSKILLRGVANDLEAILNRGKS